MPPAEVITPIVNHSMFSAEALLMAGITAVAAVVGILWKMVMDRNKRCEAENARMAEQILELTSKFGEMRGNITTLTSLIGSCKVTGCSLASLKFSKELKTNE